jgi:hypothetical protein
LFTLIFLDNLAVVLDFLDNLAVLLDFLDNLAVLLDFLDNLAVLLDFLDNLAVVLDFLDNLAVVLDFLTLQDKYYMHSLYRCMDKKIYYMYSMWTKVIPFPPSSLYISYKTIYFHNILMKSFLI